MSDEIATTFSRRQWLFGFGVVSAALAVVGVVLCFTVPFPTVKLPDGSVSISPWDDRVLFATIALSFLASALGGFGRRLPRILAIASGPVLALLAVAGFIQNHV